MTAIKRYKVLYDSSAAGNGDWIRLDSRYDISPQRIVHVDLTSGDTIELQGTVKDEKGSTPSLVTASLDTDDIVTIETFTADSTEHLLTGPWTYIRVVKTGTTGNAKVSGFV
jgi:hypothetical protein